MHKPIYEMSVLELQKQLQQKDIEYRDALKAKKVFWQLKKIVEQKREIEKLLTKRKAEKIN